MNAHGRVIRGGPAVVLGEVTARRWTCIAAEHEDEDGDMVADPAPIGRVTLERRANFAWRDEAENWLAEQASEGWRAEDPVPLATGYHGPTDSPSNCWSATATREEALT